MGRKSKTAIQWPLRHVCHALWKQNDLYFICLWEWEFKCLVRVHSYYKCAFICAFNSSGKRLLTWGVWSITLNWFLLWFGHAWTRNPPFYERGHQWLQKEIRQIHKGQVHRSLLARVPKWNHHVQRQYTSKHQLMEGRCNNRKRFGPQCPVCRLSQTFWFWTY